MDVRRSGDFAFGTGVLGAGVALLALAVCRLNAPIASAALRDAPLVLARVAPAHAMRPHSSAHVAVRKRPPVKRAGSVEAYVAARAPHPSASIAMRGAGAKLASLSHVRPAPIVAASPGARSIPLALASRKVNDRSGLRRRYGVAYVHVAPKVDRTPEPPIGYEEHPALLRAPAPTLESDPFSP